MKQKTPLVPAVLIVDGFLAVGGVAATQDRQVDSTGVQPHSRGISPSTTSLPFTDTTPSDPGVVVAGLTTGIGERARWTSRTPALPGEHTAYIVPVSGLSETYTPGNVTSPATADAISDQSTGTVSVTVTESGDPATDTTGDGRLSALDGDGTFDIVDVQALFTQSQEQSA